MTILLERGGARRPVRAPIRMTELPFSPLLRLGNMLTDLLASRRAMRKLQSLDDGALKDIGVSRGGIEWPARNGREDGS